MRDTEAPNAKYALRAQGIETSRVLFKDGLERHIFKLKVIHVSHKICKVTLWVHQFETMKQWWHWCLRLFKCMRKNIAFRVKEVIFRLWSSLVSSPSYDVWRNLRYAGDTCRDGHPTLNRESLESVYKPLPIGLMAIGRKWELGPPARVQYYRGHEILPTQTMHYLSREIHSKPHNTCVLLDPSQMGAVIYGNPCCNSVYHKYFTALKVSYPWGHMFHPSNKIMDKLA